MRPTRNHSRGPRSAFQRAACDAQPQKADCLAAGDRNIKQGGFPTGDEVLEENVSDKTQYATDTPVGAALIAQAMDRREGAGRYKAMQSVMDWDNSRLAYRAVKRAFDIVFSGVVLAIIAIPSLVLAAAIRLESEGNPFYSQIRVGQTHPDGSLSILPHVEVPLHVQRRR